MPATYVNIASQTLGSSAASVTFSNIPQTYTDLMVRISARSDNATVNDAAYFRLNAVSSTTYSETDLSGTGSSAIPERTSNNNYGGYSLRGVNGGGSTASTFGNGELYIPNYTVSTNKPMGFFGANETNATNIDMTIGAVLWRNTAAITSIVFTCRSFSNFVSGSTFYLYGIKNS
jgi:hypothetical protein